MACGTVKPSGAAETTAAAVIRQGDLALCPQLVPVLATWLVNIDSGMKMESRDDYVNSLQG